MLIQVSIEDLIKVPLILNYDSDENCEIVLYSSNATGFLQFYTLLTDLSSKPKQITSGKDPILGGYLSPKGDKLTFLRDKGGNEISNLFLLSTEGGEPKQLTNTPYRTLGLAWHPNGKEITRSFISMKGCGLETINLETKECFMLKAPIPPLMVGNYSHDGKWLACTEMKSLTNTQVLILNR
ncbi:MAG: TolB family protein, partial [Promethearchaeota archaeon]